MGECVYERGRETETGGYKMREIEKQRRARDNCNG